MNAAITTCPLMAQLRWVIPKNLPLPANARSYQLDVLRLNSPGGSQLANYDDRRDDGASRPVSSASFAAVHAFETI
jgi:hypothetical protein